jgi:hypothetical protein
VFVLLLLFVGVPQGLLAETDLQRGEGDLGSGLLVLQESVQLKVGQLVECDEVLECPLSFAPEQVSLASDEVSVLEVVELCDAACQGVQSLLVIPNFFLHYCLH